MKGLIHLKISLLILFLLSAGGLLASPKSAYHWNRIKDGILYTKYSFSKGQLDYTTIHAFELDLAKVRLGVVTASSPGGASVKNMADENGALLVINGGFFSAERKAIGLLFNNGKMLNPIHNTSWWSIFGVKNGEPFIVKPKLFESSPDIEVAIQAGPRLVIDGVVPKLKEGLAARSSVGITRDNKIVILITEGTPISLEELAKSMSEKHFGGGFECVNAMALDGGSSSQLYAKIGSFELSLPGLTSVPNGLAVFTGSSTSETLY